MRPSPPSPSRSQSPASTRGSNGFPRTVVARQALEDLYDRLKLAMKFVLEYLQKPDFRDARATLQQAEEAAKYVYANERVRNTHF